MYNEITSRILVNGQLSDEVVIGRGIRQGCPLSPVLYVLFIEPLAQLIMSHKGIQGFRIQGGGGKSIKILQYADDATCVLVVDCETGVELTSLPKAVIVKLSCDGLQRVVKMKNA